MSMVRKIKKEDYAEVCKLMTSKEEFFLVCPRGTYPLTIEQIEELTKVRKELAVIEDNNKIIGFANLYDYEPMKFAFIGNVIIDKNHRFKGLGRKLISHMIESAFKSQNLPEIRISVFNSNTQAMLLYSSMGFVPYNIESKVDNSGLKVALIHMKKERVNAT